MAPDSVIDSTIASEAVSVGATPTQETKYCSGCQQGKSLSKFGNRRVNGKLYKKSRCKTCTRKKDWNNSKHKETVKTKKRLRNKKWRVTSPREVVIFADCRAHDKSLQLANDLDIDFIASVIKNGCLYCGTTDTMITLDRIDNSIGHVKTNVNPACLECNLTRGSMPYEAWLIIAEAMKRARQLGLLSGWQRRMGPRRSIG